MSYLFIVEASAFYLSSFFNLWMYYLLTFEIQNKKLKELCKQVDGLKPEDQEIVCHFLDIAVKQDQLKQLVIRP